MITRIRHPGRPAADIDHGPCTPVSRRKGSVAAAAPADALPALRRVQVDADQHRPGRLDGTESA